MPLPRASNARTYYRCALQRFEEAQILREADKTTGAVYLAGYGVECMLKALALSVIPEARHDSTIKRFRREVGHDYQSIRTLYLENGGARLPVEVTRWFLLVDDWSTELRYDPVHLKAVQADEFLRAAKLIIQWIDGRL